MFKKIIKLSQLLFILILIILNISFLTTLSKNNSINQTSKEQITKDNKDNSIGTLIIKKINLKQNLYSINNPKNNIEENVTILKESIMPDKENSIVFLAAHSGTGEIAYFNELDKLKKDDEIILVYKNKKYKYYVDTIWEEEKNGYINVNKETKNQLILTTCSPSKKDKQLVINCIIKDS